MSTKQTNAEKMQAGWGNSAPAWVQTLAKACDAAGTRKTARKIGVSPACISWAVRNERGYKFTFVQGKTESILMASIIACPIKGAITRPNVKKNKPGLLWQQTVCGHSSLRPANSVNIGKVNKMNQYGPISNGMKQRLVELSALVSTLPQEKREEARPLLADLFTDCERVQGLETMPFVVAQAAPEAGAEA